MFAKEFTLDFDSGYNDVAHMQHDLLYICLLKDISRWILLDAIDFKLL